MEFLRAATCADELEVLRKRMDDYDEEVDPSGRLLEISGQTESVFGQGSGETPISAESAKDEEVASEKAAGKAPEISPEEETAAGPSRMSGTKMFLWRLYGRIASWERSDQNRQTGKMFDSTKGYPGEGPTNVGVSDIYGQAMSWVPDMQLGCEVAKKQEVSSTLNDVGSLGLESEGRNSKKAQKWSGRSPKKAQKWQNWFGKTQKGSEMVREEPKKGSETVREEPKKGSETVRQEPEKAQKWSGQEPQKGSEMVRGGAQKGSEMVLEELKTQKWSWESP